MDTESFNSRTREGCDAEGVCLMIGVEVSIHAPARGATLIKLLKLDQGKVSIHAPARGATLRPKLHTQRQISFNSRTREGCDRLEPIQAE